MRIHFVCFTYVRDAASALLLAKTVEVHGHTIDFIDDAAHPMGFEEINAIRATGAGYRQSHWERNGNLNGRLAVDGILASLDRARHADGSRLGVDWVVKIDSDTLPTAHLYKVLAATKSNAVGTLTGDETGISLMCGAMYAIRPEVIVRMRFWFLGLCARYAFDDAKLSDYLNIDRASKILPEDRSMYGLLCSMYEPVDSGELGWFDHSSGILYASEHSRAVSFGCYVKAPRPTPEQEHAAMLDYFNKHVA